ncbi:hypothetical protein, partial [Salmonella sp. s54925]|uniref:hypothetical protein n=1 Tax=Salmonella sp. s54925 TaxID=3159674 RepID=UPI00398035F9
EDNEVSLNDTFSEDERIIEASIRQSMFRKPLEKNRRYIYFGRMFRHRNKTMKAASEQFMVSNLFNTMAESAVTKIMRRGFRKKYTQGCNSGCHVQTVFRETTKLHEKHCFWRYNPNLAPKKDCRADNQFCLKGNDGLCHWKKTKLYYKCISENKMP